jgi:hypothetical protein
MEMARETALIRWAILLLILVITGVYGCSLFDTRDAEPPTKSSDDFKPPTVPDVVITNLQSAIAQRNVTNYMSCFADPTRVSRPFLFVPSVEAGIQYPTALGDWAYHDEQEYLNNLLSKASPNGFSSLVLTEHSTVVSTDSVTYSFDYVFTFEHTELGFPSTARGNLHFTLLPDNNNLWSIQTWIDYKTTDEISWSSFKGRFSN